MNSVTENISLDKIIDGKLISSKVKAEIKEEVSELVQSGKRPPGLAFILVGEDPASKVYVKNKGKACSDIGFYSVTEKLPDSISEEELINLIQTFNNDEKIDGILVQLPLPKHINEQRVIESINYKKDVDGFHPENTGRLVSGIKSFIPCTPYGITELLKRYNIETSGKNVTVIGRSNIVGKPIANLLIQKEYNATVSICHSKTKDLKSYTLNADIIIAAIGSPDFLKGDMIREDVVIIDVGINRVESSSSPNGYKITGDVDFESCLEKCKMITPVPGGVGPMTIAMLMKNTLDSYKKIIYS
ncbi:MAG: bifunctional methylenetetrahydrofolate dehydrogenase/methenyltetrahydrofolate cyclohydrolase FolD [Ignavibacteria bacterium]|nr:bifunctional methylenetetrahydrofolate dehydrogenase/methenyltetrahydrofolate cyclohydrolase FolD [Ignavibacteria bacterium]